MGSRRRNKSNLLDHHRSGERWAGFGDRGLHRYDRLANPDTKDPGAGAGGIGATADRHRLFARYMDSPVIRGVPEWHEILPMLVYTNGRNSDDLIDRNADAAIGL